MKLQNIYSVIHRRYELTNHIISLGMDILWRKKAARLAVKLLDGGSFARCLDICSGTGETAAYIARFADRKIEMTCADFSGPMLIEAKKKQELKAANFVMTDALRLPFKDGSFDVVTISFATRNINRSRDSLLACFREFRRVLKSQGTFINLETSRPKNRLISFFFDLYCRLVVHPFGAVLSGSNAGFKYLSSSMISFYPPSELSRLMTDAGFESVAYDPLMFGAAAIHIAKK